MKEKILLLIAKRLDNITHENIFHTRQRSYGGSMLGNPITLGINTVQHTTDSTDFKTETKRTHVDILDFELVFEDGEPNIQVGENICSTTTQETSTVSKKGFFSKIITTKIEDVQHTYKKFVRVGHVKIELTDQEGKDLMDATKKAYERYLELKLAFDDETVMQKLDLRLNS